MSLYLHVKLPLTLVENLINCDSKSCLFFFFLSIETALPLSRWLALIRFFLSFETVEVKPADLHFVFEAFS